MNIIRYVFIGTILLALCLSMANAKHIIVIYDVSGSMISPRGSESTAAIRRVNSYLTDILYENPPQSLDNRDRYTKGIDTTIQNQPLYQSGDIITYSTYANRRVDKITRKQVQRNEFHQLLPTTFPGQDSNLIRAEVEVYDQLYRPVDGETYWILVTDNDIDITRANDSIMVDLITRQNQIEEEFHSPMILDILVNGHVRIKVRQIQLISKAMFIANLGSPDKLVEEILLKKDKSGQFYSEDLIIDTKISNATRYKLNNVEVEIFDKNGNPLQFVNDDSGVSTQKLAPVLLQGKTPPTKFQIPFPANANITDSGKLKLKVNYTFNDNADSYTLYTDYESVDSNVYISNFGNSKPIEKVILRLSEGSYRAPLVIRTKSPNKSAFRIEKISGRILFDDNRKLCDVRVATIPTNLDEQFEIVVPKVRDLRRYGNKLVMDIDYHYNQTAESGTIQTLFDTRGDTSGVLSIILIIIVAIGLIIGIVLLVNRIMKGRTGGVTHEIMLQADGKEARIFSLTNGTLVSFGQAREGEYSYDVGSSAHISCKKGKIKFHKNLHDEEGSELTPGKPLETQKSDGEQVKITFEFVNTDSNQPQDSDPIIENTYDDDDLLPP